MKMSDSSSPVKSSLESDSGFDLEKLLQNPKKTSADWQTSAARLTAVEHNKLLSIETGDAEYMRSLALCRWAQSAGVTDAKKKNLQATRFRTKVPPPLDLLGQTVLVNFALELIISLRGDWCKNYIASQLHSQYLDKKGLTSLLKWAEKTAQSVTDLLETLFLESSTFKKNEKLTLMLIKDASSRIKFSQHLPTEIAAINLLAAVQFLIQLLSVDQSKKLSSALASLLQRLVHQVRLSHPTVVIHGPFVMAIKTIQEKLTKTIHKKTAQDTVFQQLGPTLSVLADLSTTGGQDSINYGRLLLPSLRSTYPNFDTQFDELTLLCPVLTQLKETDLNVLENNLEDTAISIYARLLPSWHEFYIAENEQGKLASMNTDLLEAAKLNGIEFLNIAGEEVTFDPVVHRLHKSELPATETVCILRPAVIFRRANGTHRIVLPAIVAPI